MTPVHARPAELALPVAAMSALRRALTQQVGADPAALALRAAGSAAGAAMFRSFAYMPGAEGNGNDEGEVRKSLGDLSSARFWERFSVFFSSRGWGHLGFVAAHPGVGALDALDWVEADPNALTARPSCFFTTGMLAGLLGHITGAEVAVLEVECRAQGHTRCRFLFGAPPALEAVYRDIAAGRKADESLAALT